MPSAVTSIIGGFQGSSAAHNAANAASAGYNSAATTVQNGVRDANNKIDSYYGGAANDARTAGANEGDRVLNTAQSGATKLTDVARQGGSDVVDAAGRAGSGAVDAGARAAAGLDPYATSGAHAAGELDTLLARGGRLNRPASAEEILQQDPGYNFRLQQGQQALERSQAAQGAVGGGGALKALARYSQGAASDEYGRAFDRYRATNQDLVNNLSGVADRGASAARYQGDVGVGTAEYAGNQGTGAAEFNANQNTGAAATAAAANDRAAQYAGNANINAAQYAGNAQMRSADQQGANTIGGATYAGNAQIGAAGAKAAGDIGAANAWNSALSGIGQAANSAILGGFGGGGGFNFGGAVTGNPKFGRN